VQIPFDVTTYGSPAATGVDGRPTLTTATPYTRRFTARIASRLMFFDGEFGAYNVINDRLYPDGDMFMVDPGDVVEVTVRNVSFVAHPMHLHGHSFTVLARDGRPLSGSPVELDTLHVAPGETWTLGFRADNPGLWMFHCHNLQHATQGMDLMVGYSGVTTPFRAGRATGNRSE
jgi:FtsP/CotA-like multicopper oxidase with cupredoxin domain